MDRGDVYLINMELPNRQGGAQPENRSKYVIVLQGGPIFASTTEVAVVVASTYRSRGRARPFEVLLGQAEGFDHDTVVDGRWVFTISKAKVQSGRYRFQLDSGRMTKISVAIVAGLELR